MHITLLDWGIIVGVLLINLAIALSFASKAGKSLEDFFLSGRKLPWYIAGVSMVATTFAADTPLAVTEIVNKQGISGNWLWWNFLIGGLLTTFFFAKLWRRAGVVTELEFINIRYSGISAKILRVFKVFYHGLFMNAIIIGWVNLAFISILQVFFDLPKEEALLYTGGVMLFVAIYSSLSGLWGVVLNDVVQFFIAMFGCIILAYFVLASEDIGGVDGLVQKLPEGSLNFFPTLGDSLQGNATILTLSIGSFLAYACFQWWATWYPGAEPGGGGYIAQRMMSAKDEKNAVWATLFFQIAHYCIRPWPWIIVGLCTIVLYPELGADEKRLGYIMTIKEFMPPGYRGLLLVGLFAAYMSTISTQLNWGASYVVNDFYKPFIDKLASGKKQVAISRITTIVLMLFSLAVTTQMDSISGVWQFIIECGAGLGLVLILRWYWWRINAWTEIAATILPFVAFFIAQQMDLVFPNSFFFVLSITTIGWLIVAFVSPATDEETLDKFIQKVKPSGSWGRRASINQGKLRYAFLSWGSSVIMVYSILFGMGKLIFKDWMMALIFLAVACVAFTILRYAMQREEALEV